MTIKSKVLNMIDKYRTNDPFEIADARNIVVLSEKLGNILGYYNFSKRMQMIHLNKSLDSLMRRFVCAHELGHSILHPQLNTPFLRKNTLMSVDKIEREANTFAVELIITDKSLTDMGCTTLESAAITFGIPYETVSLKMLRL